MLTVNLFGGPGIGKSSIAAGLFSILKRNNINVELVTEYAKDLVYEERKSILQDQLYILAKQNRRLSRLVNQNIEIAIVDSPLLLGTIYYKINGGTSENFIKVVEETFNSYENLNFYLKRNTESEFNTVGRVQKSLDDAINIDKQILDYLKQLKLEYVPINVNIDSTVEILMYIVSKLMKISKDSAQQKNFEII